MTSSEIAIIGGGPAGLAAMAATQPSDCVLFESGQGLDRRDECNTAGIAEGVGGAGLFSDGKFSFYPSASALWKLDVRLVGSAWAWLCELLDSVGIVHDAPAEMSPPSALSPFVKSYPSVYGSPAQRRQIIELLGGSGTVFADERVLSVVPRGGWWTLETSKRVHVCRRLILAMGRFGPLGIMSDMWSRFRRIELGVRICQRSGEFFLANHRALDPKVILPTPGGAIEWRTFCCCREGEVVRTTVGGISSLSGRADCPPTGTSNVGFNVRTHLRMEPQLAGDLVRRIGNLAEIPPLAFESAVDNSHVLVELFESPVAELLAQGLAELVRVVGRPGMAGAWLLGPAIEGVGYYPDHDEQLSCREEADLWVAGDMAGDFRGLVAALMSGWIAGTAARERDGHE